MYGCESRTIKKAERWRFDVFELWCWRRLLKVPWTIKSKQSVLKDISHWYSLQGLMLKLKLQYFGHLMWRTDSLENTLILGKIEGRRRNRWQRMRWFDSITNSMDTSLCISESWWRTGKPVVLQSMLLPRDGHELVTEQLQGYSYKHFYKLSILGNSNMTIIFHPYWLTYKISIILSLKMCQKFEFKNKNHHPKSIEWNICEN